MFYAVSKLYPIYCKQNIIIFFHNNEKTSQLFLIQILIINITSIIIKANLHTEIKKN